MPRRCVICNKSQSAALAVFRFPSTLDQQAAWVRIIRQVLPDFGATQDAMSRELKNGVCEKHFLKEHINRGKKCRLQKDVVPTIDPFQSSASKVIYLSEGSPITSSILETKLFRSKSTQTEKDIKFVAESNLVIEKKDLEEIDSAHCFLCEGLFEVEVRKVASCSPQVIELIMASFSIKEKEKQEILSRVICGHCFTLLNDISSLQILLKTKLDQLNNVCKMPRRKSNRVNLSKFNIFESIMRTEQDNFTPSCSTCSKTVSSGEELIVHSIKHKTTNDCPICGRYLTTRPRLHCHMLKFHGVGQPKEKIYKCESCSKSFTTSAGLKYHVITVHEKKINYSCKICKKNFCSRLLYRSHMLYMHGKKNILCKLCDKSFFTGAKLNSHVNAVHRNAYTWTCKLCSAKFTTTKAYQNHCLLKHNKLKYKCKHCSAEFSRKSALVLHMHRHELFLCSYCDMEFTNHHSLSSHMIRVHQSKKFNKTNFVVKIVGSDLSNIGPVSTEQKFQHDAILSNDKINFDVCFDQKKMPSIEADDILSDTFTTGLTGTSDPICIETLENLPFVSDFDSNDNLAISSSIDDQSSNLSTYEGTLGESISLETPRALNELGPIVKDGKDAWGLAIDEDRVTSLNVDEISLDTQSVDLSKPLAIAGSNFSTSNIHVLDGDNVSTFILDEVEKDDFNTT